MEPREAEKATNKCVGDAVRQLYRRKIPESLNGGKLRIKPTSESEKFTIVQYDSE